MVAGVDLRHFDADLAKVQGDTEERELDFVALRDLAHLHLDTYAREAAAPFRNPPTCSFEKLTLAASPDPGTAKRLALTAAATAFRMQWEQQSPFRG